MKLKTKLVMSVVVLLLVGGVWAIGTSSNPTIQNIATTTGIAKVADLLGGKTPEYQITGHKDNPNYDIYKKTKNGLRVTWYPVFVGPVDKEYNITVEGLSDQTPDMDAFFGSFTRGVKGLQQDTVELYYLTQVNEMVSNWSQECTQENIVLSKGSANQTDATVDVCSNVNNPYLNTVDKWIPYTLNKVTDEVTQEVKYDKTTNSGKVDVYDGSTLNLKLKFKTNMMDLGDGSFGQDGIAGLKFDGELFHPPFNSSFSKRILINISTDHALTTNYTHNVTFALTGNSTELGTQVLPDSFGGILACEFMHVIYNDGSGDVELDRHVDSCNTSTVNVHFRNQEFISASSSVIENYTIYYDPIGGNTQPPQTWQNIYLPISDSFDEGLNSSLWLVDNTTQHNSSWRNITYGVQDGVMRTEGGVDGNRGCFQNQNTTATTLAGENFTLEFAWNRTTVFDTGANNRGYGMNTAGCPSQSPNLAYGIFNYGDAGTQKDNNLGLRNNNGAVRSTSSSISGLNPHQWIFVSINRSSFPTDRSGVFIDAPTVSEQHFTLSTQVPDYTLRPFFFYFGEAGGANKINDVSYVRIFDTVSGTPTYATQQGNGTFDLEPTVNLINPVNKLTNATTSHVFFANATDDKGLVNATLYHNGTGSWAANLTNTTLVNNDTTFHVGGFVAGDYEWNVLFCDTINQCNFADANFTFEVGNSPTIPNASEPANNTFHVTPSILFNCSGSTDADGDPISVEFYYGTGSGANATGTLLQNTTATSFNWTTIPEDDIYWTCRANSKDDRSEFTPINVFTQDTSTLKNFTQDFVSPVQEFSTNEFNITIQVNNGTVRDLKANLTYNFTEFGTTRTNLTNNTYFFSSSVTAPALTSQTNITFGWNITADLFNDTFEDNNTQQFGQIVNFIDIFNCTTTNETTGVLYNFTMFEEQTRSIINTSTESTAEFDANFVIWQDGNGGVPNKTVKFDVDDRRSVLICVTPPSTELRVRGQIQYRADGFDVREWYTIGNESKVNNTNVTELNLFPIALGSAITFTVTDELGIGEESVVIDALRQDIGNASFFSVERGKTNDDGQENMFLRKQDVFYKFRVYNLAGDLLVETGVTKLLEDTFSIVVKPDPFSEVIDKARNLVYTLQNITGNVIRLTWSDPDQDAKLHCLSVTHRNITTDTTLCSSCSGNTSGAISCDYSNSTNGTIIGSYYTSINPFYPIETITILIVDDIVERVGADGLLIGVLLIGAFGTIGLAAGSPAVIILGPFALVGLAMMGIVRMSAEMLIFIVFVSMIVAWVTQKQGGGV